MRSFYETGTQRNIRFPLCFFVRTQLRKLQGHEDVLDDRTQNIRVGIIGSGADMAVGVAAEVQGHMWYARPGV